MSDSSLNPLSLAHSASALPATSHELQKEAMLTSVGPESASAQEKA